MVLWLTLVDQSDPDAEPYGVDPGEARRVQHAPGLRAGPMTAFVVTLPESRADGWDVEKSPETTAARWVLAGEVRRMHLVRQVREVGRCKLDPSLKKCPMRSTLEQHEIAYVALKLNLTDFSIELARLQRGAGQGAAESGGVAGV